MGMVNLGGLDSEPQMELAALLTGSTPALGSLALLVGRVFIGVCFIIHALGKLGLVGSGNMSGFVAWLEDLGVPYAPIQARVAMLSELVGGTLLLLGMFARPACVLLIATMTVATRIGHRDAGYLITNDPPGGEYTINLAVVCGMFLLFGPGVVSLDYLLF
jgi:putative oxidoreductase